MDKKAFLLSALAASGAGFAAMRFWLPAGLKKLESFAQSKKFWVPLCGVFLAGYLALQICSAVYPGYLELIEPHVASVSFVFLRGAPLYHALDSPQRYSLFYGPMAYLPYTLALRVMGANVLSLKLVVLIANLLLLGLLWKSYRLLLDAWHTLLTVAVVIAYWLLSGDYVFQVRGDTLIILCVALGLFAVLRSPLWVSALLLALGCGFAFDVKITAIFYFLPLFILCIRGHGWRRAAWALAGAVLFALVPFFLPRISAAGYLNWLHQASRQPLSRTEVPRELKLLVAVCAPLALLLWQSARRSRNGLAIYLGKNRVFLVTLGGCLTAVAISAAKIGAGPHHFMPFYPIVGYACADLYRAMKGTTMAQSVGSRWNLIPLLWFWLALGLATQLATGFSSTVSTLLTSRPFAASVISDLREVMRTHPGKKIEMGYGQMNAQYKLTFFRPLLVFAGNPLTIDAVALGDMQLSGVEMPQSTLEYLRACRTQIWLIPKGDPPFAMVNIYSLIDPRAFPARQLFGDDFRRIFFQQFHKQGSSQHFDIWECAAHSDRPPDSKD